MTQAGFTTPANAYWRSDAALTHLALGDPERARVLAREELRLSRAFGAPQAIGIALRTLGLFEAGTCGISHLKESVAVLGGSASTLELSRSQVELGASLRRAGNRRAARDPLRSGLDLATRTGAPGLAERARDELIAAGGRPRRPELKGSGSLTASELRVAQMAVDGRTNREIAQSLFVTRRTVEVHLTNAYRKLGIGSRQELQSALMEGTTADSV